MPILGGVNDIARRSSLAAPVGAGGRAGAELGPLEDSSAALHANRAASFLAACANPSCSSGWLHLLRSRSGPFFEGGWTCSATCTLACVEAAVHRELEGRRSEALRPELLVHRHRVPLGLVLLEQGWITPGQLRSALEMQRKAGHGRLGMWLMRQSNISEQCIARALCLQWSCPVLSSEAMDTDGMAQMLPRLFVEAYGALPLRVAASRILYLGFEERLDPVVALALERMHGLKVENGLVPESQFRESQQRLVEAQFPRSELIQSASEAPLARVMARILERKKPSASRLVRVHDCLWMRLWIRPSAVTSGRQQTIEDVICSLVAA